MNGRSTVPPGLFGVTAIAAGYTHSLALRGISLDVHLAGVLWWQKLTSGTVMVSGDFHAPLPDTNETIRISFDHIDLLEQPFSAFKYEKPTNSYVLTRNGVLVRLDFKNHKLFVLTSKRELAQLDYSDGVDIELIIGMAGAVNHVKLEPKGQSLLLYRK